MAGKAINTTLKKKKAVLPFHFAFQCPVIWAKPNSAYATTDVTSSCTAADVTYINTAVTGKEKQV